MSYKTILPNKERGRICKYSRSPFNRFRSQSYLFLAPQYWTKLYTKDVDQKRILNTDFQQLFFSHAATPVNYLFINIYNNNSPMIRFTVHRPTNNEKGKRLVIGNRYIFSKDDYKVNIF